MAVESSTTIKGLNAAWPLGTDIKAEGDNHLRLIKSTLQAVFDDSGTTIKTTKPVESPVGAVLPSITGNVTITGDVTISGNLKAALLLDPVLAPSSDTTKKANFDLSAVTAGQNRKIRVPDSDTVTGIWEPIATRLLTGQLTSDFTNLAPFRRLRLMGAVSAASAGLALRSSSDNGSTFLSGASDYGYQLLQASGTAVTASSAQGTYLSISGTSTDNAAVVSFEAVIDNFNVATADHGARVSSKLRLSSSLASQVWHENINVSTVMNALRLLSTGGVAMNGWVTLEGVRG